MRPIILFTIGGSLLVACAAKAPPRAADPASVTTTTQASTAEEAPACEVFCEGAEVVAQTPEQPDHHAQMVADANAVIASMHAPMLACYAKRLRVDPNAHAFLAVDIVIGPDGRVWRTETTGGARLGKEGVACVVDQIQKAQFSPPRDGGTRRVRVPLTFRRVAAGESI